MNNMRQAMLTSMGAAQWASDAQCCACGKDFHYTDYTLRIPPPGCGHWIHDKCLRAGRNCGLCTTAARVAMAPAIVTASPTQVSPVAYSPPPITTTTTTTKPHHQTPPTNPQPHHKHPPDDRWAGETITPIHDPPQSRGILGTIGRWIAPLIVANSELFQTVVPHTHHQGPLHQHHPVLQELGGALVMTDRSTGQFTGDIFSALAARLPVTRRQAEAWARDGQVCVNPDGRVTVGEGAPLPPPRPPVTLPCLQDRWPTLEDIVLAGADLKDMLEAGYDLAGSLCEFPDCCLGRLLEMGLSKEILLNYRASMPWMTLVRRFGLTPAVLVDELGLRADDMHGDGFDLAALVDMGFTGEDLLGAGLLGAWAAWEALHRPAELVARLRWTPPQLAVLRCWQRWQHDGPGAENPPPMDAADVTAFWTQNTPADMLLMRMPLPFTARMIREHDRQREAAGGRRVAAGGKGARHVQRHSATTTQRVPHGGRV